MISADRSKVDYAYLNLSNKWTGFSEKADRVGFPKFVDKMTLPSGGNDKNFRSVEMEF